MLKSTQRAKTILLTFGESTIGVKKWMQDLNFGPVENLIIQSEKDMFDEDIDHNEYLCIYSWYMEYQENNARCKNSVQIDFGDMQGEFRAVTKFISNLKTTSFGSITLPFDSFRAPQDVQDFSKIHRNNGKKIMCVAQRFGGKYCDAMLHPTKYPQFIDQNEWVFLILGFHPTSREYSESIQKIPSFPKMPPQNVLHVGFVHFEYLMDHCDFVIHSGGAGSTATPMIAGVPQFVAINGRLCGGDKNTNRESILDLGVSPIYDKTLPNVQEFFQILNANFQTYQENAVKLKNKSENEKGIQNVLEYIHVLQGMEHVDKFKEKEVVTELWEKTNM